MDLWCAACSRRGGRRLREDVDAPVACAACCCLVGSGEAAAALCVQRECRCELRACVNQVVAHRPGACERKRVVDGGRAAAVSTTGDRDARIARQFGDHLPHGSPSACTQLRAAKREWDAPDQPLGGGLRFGCAMRLRRNWQWPILGIRRRGIESRGRAKCLGRAHWALWRDAVGEIGLCAISHLRELRSRGWDDQRWR